MTIARKNADINKSFDAEGIPVLHHKTKTQKGETNKQTVHIITSSTTLFSLSCTRNPTSPYVTSNDIDVSTKKEGKATKQQKVRDIRDTIYLQYNVSLPHAFNHDDVLSLFFSVAQVLCAP